MEDQNWKARLVNVLVNDWTHARNAELELQKLRIPGSRACSRRFYNEVRDALDHMYRIADSKDPNEQGSNTNSIEEHLRRAAVETLEFHIEQKLSRLRPARLRWAKESLYDGELRIVGEVLAKTLLISRRYDELTLKELFEGQRYLAEARQVKGAKMEDTRSKLQQADESFRRAAEAIDGGGFNVRVFELLLMFSSLGIGFALTYFGLL